MRRARRCPSHSEFLDAAPRRVDYLRLSITDRCNLRCVYCMPPQGVPARAHGDILSYEELASFARVAVQCGISKIRVTGGEPLVRRGCAEFVGMLARTSGVNDISLTTNGVLLASHARDLRRQGLRRVNISIDSLDPERFARITRGGHLGDVLAGLDAAFAAGFRPVKLNVLLLAGIERELDAFVELARNREVHVRFIEFMPVDRRLAEVPLSDRRLVPASEILDQMRRRHSVVPDPGPYGHGPAAYWREPGAAGTIGFVAGVSDHFCDTCNRLRLTADGRLRSCLFSGEDVNIRPLITAPRELRRVVHNVMRDKKYDRRVETEVSLRSMSQIGG